MKSVYKSILIILFIFMLAVPNTNSAAPEKQTIMQSGEILEYEVSFLGIKLGSIKVVTEEQEVYKNIKTWKAKCYMDSYDGIPFVDLHAIFETWMDPSISYSHKFVGKSKQSGDLWDYQKILFDYDTKTLRNAKWLNKEIVYDETHPLNNKYNDGLSLYFLARQFTNARRTVTVPVLMQTDSATAIINFHAKKGTAKVDAIDYPVKTIYFDGKANFTGIYGFTGRFEGWFSDDEARIPIKAKMNVYVGSVLIELKKWDRKGWQPPR